MLTAQDQPIRPPVKLPALGVIILQLAIFGSGVLYALTYLLPRRW